jgi:tetratricopeptide (TPR) repeat protein
MLMRTHTFTVAVRVFFGVLVMFKVHLVFAADVRDIGVPAGWSASEYDKHGYDLLNKHDYENARRYFDAAIRTDPSMWSAYYNRATTFVQQEKWSAALQDLNSTIRLKPSFFQASFMRAMVHSKTSNYSACLSDLTSLVSFASTVHNELEEAEALNNRAWFRATCPNPSLRNGQLAIADAKKACQLTLWKAGDTSIRLRQPTLKLAILSRRSGTKRKPSARAGRYQNDLPSGWRNSGMTRSCTKGSPTN